MFSKSWKKDRLSSVEASCECSVSLMFPFCLWIFILSFPFWFGSFFFFFPESFMTLILSLVVFVFFKTISQAPPWGLARFLCISLLYVLLLCILPSWISAAWENPFIHLVPTYCLIFLCSKSLVNLLLAWILSQMLLIFAVPQWRKGVDNDKLPLTAVAGVVKLSGVISKWGWFKPSSFPEVKSVNTRRLPPSHFLAPNSDSGSSTCTCKLTKIPTQQRVQKEIESKNHCWDGRRCVSSFQAWRAVTCLKENCWK